MLRFYPENALIAISESLGLPFHTCAKAVWAVLQMIPPLSVIDLVFCQVTF